MLLLLVAVSKERRCAVCGITFKITCNIERKQKNDFCQSEHERIPPHPTHTHIKKQTFFYLWKLPVWTCELDPTRKMIRRTSRLSNLHNTHAPPRRDRRCQNTCLYIPLAEVCPSVFSRGHWRMALLKLEKNVLERTGRIGQAWAVLSYYTDQLMTPCSKYFSGGSTLNGTPGGDRWA